MKMDCSALLIGFSLMATAAFGDQLLESESPGELVEVAVTEDPARLSQLESVVSDQLRRELEGGVSRWLTDKGVSVSPEVFDLNVDPLIGYTESAGNAENIPAAGAENPELPKESKPQEPKILRVIVEVNFAEYLEKSLLVGVVDEVSSMLADRGYVFKKTVPEENDPRPLAHVEVNAPEQMPIAAGTVAIAPAAKGLDMRRALTGATLTILTAIILLVAFVLRQIRIPNSGQKPDPYLDSYSKSPDIDYGEPRGPARPVDGSFEQAALERGKNLQIGGSLALMNFDQAISFLGKLDRLHRKAVLAKLPVHSSIKVRLAKALTYKPLVNTAK